MPSLLLATAPNYDTATVLGVVGGGVLFLISAASGLEKIWGWVTGGAKKREAAIEAKLAELAATAALFVDKDALDKRFGGIEDRSKLLAAEVLNQNNTLHEYERKRAELTGEFRAAIAELRKDVHTLEPMPARVNTLENKLDNLVAQITDLKAGQRELKQEMREDMRSNKNEVLEAIAKISR